MAGRNRIPMTSGVGVMYYNCNPVLRKHWISTRFRELQEEAVSEEFIIIPITEEDEELIDGGPKIKYMSKDELLKKYRRNK